MPVFHFHCPECREFDSQLLTSSRSRGIIRCRKTPGCGGQLVRQPVPPQMIHSEVIDNGIMQRRVERPIDQEKLLHERAQKDYKVP